MIIEKFKTTNIENGIHLSLMIDLFIIEYWRIISNSLCRSCTPFLRGNDCLCFDHIFKHVCIENIFGR